MRTPEPGTVIDGKYRVLKSLGHGGFAGTYLAEDINRQNNKVVVKLPDLNQLGDPATYERFRRELSIGKKLKHPDLVVAIDYSEGTPPYLVFEYLDNETLSAVLDGKRLFSVNKTIEMVTYLLDALNYCHEQGVIHRDIKPENIMVGDDGHLKIIDFGIAMADNATRVTYRGFSGLVGTPEYMSPEQIKGERGNEQSDIYAVGCLLYHMLAGFPPYTGDNPMTTMYQHLTSSPKPLTLLRPDLNKGIWAVVCHAMRRKKEERYHSAAEMAEDLRNLDKVDLSYIDQPNPPMASVSQSKHFNKLVWIITAAAVIFAAAMGLLVYYINK